MNRAVLSVHTPHELVAWRGPEAEPAMTRSFQEYDRWRHERVVAVPSGQSVTVSLSLAGFAWPGEQYRLHVGHQPVVNDDQIEIDVETGGARLRHAGRLDGDLTLAPAR